MKIETKKQLKEIYNLLDSKDFESKVLGYSLFQESQFRKFIRNKCYSLKNGTVLHSFKYILNPLFHVCRKEDNEDYIYSINIGKIENLKSILKLYIEGDLIFRNYSEYKRFLKCNLPW